MSLEWIELSEAQCAELEERLASYDLTHMGVRHRGSVSVGILSGGGLIAGADGCITAFRIFYLSTLFVDEAHRRKGIGRRLMERVEERARQLGANMIRLDTFDWQGAEFYRKLGYEQVGGYENPQDGFSEYFFMKHL